MLATCFLLSSRTELSACCAMQMSLNVSKPFGRSVKNLHTPATKLLKSFSVARWHQAVLATLWKV